MKILVLSDSHSALSFMYRCVQTIKPDAIIHLGDYFDDGQALHEAFPEIPSYQVPGNCDRYRCPPGQPEILAEQIGGVTLYLTHGHLHRVKSGTGGLLASARESGAAAVLYGHTHQADCRQEPDGLWVLNPGHLHRVKSGTGGLLASARESGAAAVLYGHTHQADCRQEPDGLWVLNPGSCHRVKSGTGGLLASARESGAAAVLYGHTHQADCRQEPDGLWVLNPGSCSGYGGSAGVLELDGGSVVTCRILQAADLLLEAATKENRP